MKKTSDRILVLMYHRVGKAQNDWEARYCISPEGFAAHMNVLAAKGYRAVAAEDLVSWLAGGPPLPAGAFVLTFDDGFRGVGEFALPILEKRDWPFTVFLVSDMLGGEDTWTRTKNPSGRTYPLLTVDEVMDMQQRGVSFQSHTRTHASLPALDDGTLIDQLSSSRKFLTNLLGHNVDFLAYPFGHMDERVETATRNAGYLAAFSVQPGFNRKNINRFCIRRLDIFGTDSPAMLLRKIRLGSNDGTMSSMLHYYYKRLIGRFT